jgi:hypothetical protein
LAKIYLDRKKLEVYETLVDISLREALGKSIERY